MKKFLFLFMFFYINIYAVTITESLTLTEDTVYNENLTVDGCVLNLDGYTLTINGDFKTTSSYGRLRMQKSDGKLIVNGDVTFGGSSTYQELTKGSLELTGNFYQIGTKTWNGYTQYSTKDSTKYSAKYQSNNAYSFYPTEDFKVVFNGTEKQTVNFQAPRYSRFIDIEILNSSEDGVEFEQLNVIGELTRNDNNIKVGHIENWKLTEDLIIPNDITIYEVLNLDGYTLTVNGDFKTTSSYARLRMQKSDGKLIVNGDVTFGGSSTYEELTKGSLELTGNFYQIGTERAESSYHEYSKKNSTNNSAKYQNNNAYSFYPTEDFKVVFNGTEKQTVNFQAPKYSRFNDIEIANEVEFEKVTNVIRNLYTTEVLYESTYKDSTMLTYINYLDSAYYYLNINAGMNLLALPNVTSLTLEDMKTIFANDITTIWTYDGASLEWSGFSQQTDRIEKFVELELKPLESLHKGEGFIVNSLTTQTLLIPKGDAYDIKDLNILEELSSGWHLVGSNRAISTKTIKELNPNIIAIWSYDGAKWLADAVEDEFILNIDKRGIKPLTNIKSNSAFWVYVK